MSLRLRYREGGLAHGRGFSRARLFFSPSSCPCAKRLPAGRLVRDAAPSTPPPPPKDLSSCRPLGWTGSLNLGGGERMIRHCVTFRTPAPEMTSQVLRTRTSDMRWRNCLEKNKVICYIYGKWYFVCGHGVKCLDLGWCCLRDNVSRH